MDEQLCSRFLSNLECFEPSGREQVIAYLRMIEARAGRRVSFGRFSVDSLHKSN